MSSAREFGPEEAGLWERHPREARTVGPKWSGKPSVRPVRLSACFVEQVAWFDVRVGQRASLRIQFLTGRLSRIGGPFRLMHLCLNRPIVQAHQHLAGLDAFALSGSQLDDPGRNVGGDGDFIAFDPPARLDQTFGQLDVAKPRLVAYGQIHCGREFGVIYSEVGSHSGECFSRRGGHGPLVRSRDIHRKDGATSLTSADKERGA